MVKFSVFKSSVRKKENQGQNEVSKYVSLMKKKKNDKHLDELAEVLENTEVLQTLNLSWNKFTLQNDSFANALANNRTLTTLYLGGNQIGAEGAGKLADALKVNQSLQTIDLRGNQIGDRGAGKLADALKVNMTLQTIHLGKNEIGGEGAGKLVDALRVNRTWQTIYLSLRENKIGDEGVGKLADALKVNQNLQTLDLNWNKIGAEGAGKLADALKVNMTLQTIDLGKNEIGGEGAGKLAEAPKINQTLQTIELEENQIGDEGVGKLADVLKVNQSLHTIDLNGNKIGAEGAGKIADALKVNHTLQTIYFGNNQIGAEGAGKLAEALKINQTLQTIVLGCNQIGDEGVGKIADALKANQTLQKINLVFNQIGVEGAGKIADALEVNQTLQEINLLGNQIGKEGASQLLDALRSNFTLLKMDLDGNERGDEGFDSIYVEIKSALKCNATTKIYWLPDSQTNQFPDPHTKFFSKLTSMAESSNHVGKELQELLPLICHIHMLKFFYTATSALLRSGALKKDEASDLMMEALEKSTELCLGEYEIADFKTILEKAKSDGYIDQHDLYRLDNRAEKKAIKSDPDILNLLETVKSNTARIEGLEANVEAINNSVNKIRKGLKHKMKVEAAVGFLSATINAISFGVGGNVIDAAAKALGSIVDFGDIVHIQSVAADKGAVCVEQVEAGIEIAVDRYADRKLEEALKKGSILTVVSATAVMMSPISDEAEKPDAESLKASGDSAFRKGDFTQSINFYTRAISINDSSFQVFSNRSAAYLKMSDPENALMDAVTSIKLNPKFSKGYQRKGTALHMLRRFEEAEAAFLDGLTVSPDNAALQKALDCLRRDEGYKAEFESKHLREGNSSLENGNFAKAVESFSKAIDLNNSGHHFSLRSAAYLKIGDSEKALADALSVVKLSPDTGTGYYLKGKALYALRRFDEAISAFQEGIQKSPDDVELQSGLELVKKDMIESKKMDPDGEHIIDVVNDLGQSEEKFLSDAKPAIALGEEQRKSESGSSELGDVERWLLSRLPELKKEDLIRYSNRLVGDGFETFDLLDNELEEDDLGFMKKAHKRAVARTLNSSKHH